MDTKTGELETPELTCHVSEVESGGYRLIVKRDGKVVRERLDDDLEEIERIRARYLDPEDLLSKVLRWGGVMNQEEMEEMLDAIYAERGRDWRPT